MVEKIRGAIKTYISMLNMRPEVVRTSEKMSLSIKDDRDTPLWIHIGLFAVTIATTTIAGSQSSNSIVEVIISGLPFSLTIITILLSHEMGHYLAARHFGVRATLPYFIPFPSIIGTMGAVIKIKSRIQDKRALLYIGAMGPLIGFLLSLIATVVGIYLSEIKRLPVVTGDMMVPIFGDSILFSIITRIIHGEIPPGYDIFLSPYAWAGWIGFLVTSLNLMPMGQLDGSHILYSLIGDKQLLVGWSTFFGLVVLSFIWQGWILWILIALLFLMIGHPPVDEGRPLSFKERVIGWTCVFILILTFIPVPVSFLSGSEGDAKIFPIECDFCREGLDPSGITSMGGRLFFVSDNDYDYAVYGLIRDNAAYSVNKFITFNSSYTVIKKHKNYDLDLEGIVWYRDSFFVVDERDRYIYKIKDNSSVERVQHDIGAYNKRMDLSFSLNANAGFEGIAIDPEKRVFFIANERERAIIYLLRMRGNNLYAFDHIIMDDVLKIKGFDVSDLFFERGFLYLIYRKENRIIKLDPYKKTAMKSLSYLKLARGLYEHKQSRGFAEGLYMTERDIFLLLDSGGKRMVGRSDDGNGALIIMKRPVGF
jgi:hypothetical protein